MTATIAEHRLSVPPGLKHPAIAKVAKEVTAVRAKFLQEQRDLEQLRRRREHAAAEDLKALADAIRSGKPDPGQATVEKVDEQIVQATRRVGALEVALAGLAGDLERATIKHRGELLQGCDEQIAGHRQSLGDLVEQLDAAHAALAGELALRGWLAGFPDRPHPSPAGYMGRVLGLVDGANGEPVTWIEIVAAIRDHVLPADTPAAMPDGEAA